MEKSNWLQKEHRLWEQGRGMLCKELGSKISRIWICDYRGWIFSLKILFILQNRWQNKKLSEVTELISHQGQNMDLHGVTSNLYLYLIIKISKFIISNICFSLKFYHFFFSTISMKITNFFYLLIQQHFLWLDLIL